jgi:hypothetical protein
MNTKNLFASLITGLALSISAISPSLAHDNAYFDSIKTPNGGQIRMAGPYHFELVLVKDSKQAKENTVVVHVTDHAEKAISTKGAVASLSLIQGTTKSTITLQAEGENRFVGKAVYASNANLKAALEVTFAGKGTEQARFTPFATAKKKVEKKVEKKEEAGHQHGHEHGHQH